MEIIGTLSTLYSATTTLHELRSFIRDELSRLLEEIGDNEFANAIEALKDARISQNPTREIGEAILRLRSASLTFISLAERVRGNLLRVLFTGFFRGESKLWLLEMNFYQKACQSMVIMSVCYKYLGEEELMRKQIEELIDCFYEDYGIRKYNERKYYPDDMDSLKQEEEFLIGLCENLGVKAWPSRDWADHRSWSKKWESFESDDYPVTLLP
ncbi:MAG TPA: hypothetical protein VE863_15270 [Pyrinomonadaceae bacterium]|jgi:FKBP-type peptidyl-prolyl cis-trans isomerase (trigger factor)|nr:hypothetical protein [Pyrinomonadaceae bacterium]